MLPCAQNDKKIRHRQEACATIFISSGDPAGRSTYRGWGRGFGEGGRALAPGLLPQKSYFPQHFLYFLRLPQGQGSLRPVFFCWRCWGWAGPLSPWLKYMGCSWAGLFREFLVLPHLEVEQGAHRLRLDAVDQSMNIS